MGNFNVITIEREYASGGRIIGRLVANKLGIPFYGKEILEMAAEMMNTTKDYLEKLEETTTSSLRYSLSMSAKVAAGEMAELSVNDKLNLTESKIIRELASGGPCVIVGRCAGSVLKELKKCLNIFVYSSMEERIKRAVNEYGVSEAQINHILKKTDKRRANYYSANTGKRWDDRMNYHLCIDSSKLSLEACAGVIISAFKG